MRSTVAEQLMRILTKRGRANRLTAQRLAAGLLRRVSEGGPTLAMSRSCAKMLDEEGVIDNLRARFPDRARRMAEQTKLHAKGPNILDFGCGDGEVGVALRRRGIQVFLCDLQRRLSPKAESLPWKRAKPGRGEPLFHDPVHTVLVLNVLHHTNDPDAVIADIAAQNAGRIVIIESSVGVKREDAPSREVSRIIKENPISAVWMDWSDKDQLLYNSFWDWWFAQVLGGAGRIPCRYRHPDQWKAKFKEFNYGETHRRWLGIDQPLAPEFHVLQVFDFDENQSADGVGP